MKITSAVGKPYWMQHSYSAVQHPTEVTNTSQAKTTGKMMSQNKNPQNKETSWTAPVHFHTCPEGSLERITLTPGSKFQEPIKTLVLKGSISGPIAERESPEVTAEWVERALAEQSTPGVTKEKGSILVEGGKLVSANNHLSQPNNGHRVR